MKYRRFSISLVLALLAFQSAWGSDLEINPSILRERWESRWIRANGGTEAEYEVHFLRKRFELADKPDRFVVHLSGDCRYKFYVNGELVALGPAAGDYFHWKFDTLDLAEYLKPGGNVVAALVWNGGKDRPLYQMTYQTGFVLTGNGEAESVLNTDKSWRTHMSSAYEPIVGVGHRGYYVAGPGDSVRYANYPHGWETLAFDDSDWKPAHEVDTGWPPGAKPKGVPDAAGWMLQPRNIPQMELSPQRFAALRKAEGVVVPEGFLSGGVGLDIPPHSKVTLLFDNGVLTNAYPKVGFSGGAGAEVELTYAESLFSDIPEFQSPTKGNRDIVEGKSIAGRRDKFYPDGGDGRLFESLSYRTFRYVQAVIETGEHALRIEDFSSVFTGYPFEMRAALSGGPEELEEMLEVGWHTARLCAMETYMDCPYYEQLQYIGDTRIQALVSLYNSGDDRLIRSALDLMDQSRIAEGITQSRYPSKLPQLIPTFSLWYIGMLHDYWRYGGDPDFVSDKIVGVRNVLDFFYRHQSEDGTLRDVPYWLFTDWVNSHDAWRRGIAPQGSEGESAALDLQLLLAYQSATELEAYAGMQSFEDLYRQRADALTRVIRERYWDKERSLFRDTFSRDSSVSQHVNAMAILAGVISGKEAAELAEKLEAGEGMAKASIYFRYYLHLALTKAGRGDRYLAWLDLWRQNLELGLTTWAERPDFETSRSDCHAWGSSPNIEFFRIVLGLDSAGPGWSRVRVEPHLGELTNISGEIPHPAGELSASYEYAAGKWRVEIGLPDGVDGVFVWKGSTYPLAPGNNVFNF